MNNLRLRALASLLAIALLSAQSAPAADTVRINPESLRKLTLEGNNPVLVGLNQLYQAKAVVNSARAGLFPGANLNLMLKNQSGPTFLISSVSFLLPFLLPSNWFALKQNNHLLEAEKEAYRLLQLNQYASAYAIYSTIVGDLELRDVIEQQYLNLKAVADLLERQNRQTGNASAADVKQALAQSQGALVQLSQMDELIAQEKAAVRQALGLPLTTEIAFENTHVAPSDFESGEAAKLLDQAIAISPESRQLNEMLIASRAGKWRGIFAFMTSSTLSTANNNGKGVQGGANFTGMNQNNGINLGVGYFPAVQLSNTQMDAIGLQQRDLRLSQGRILEASLASIAEALTQTELAQRAEDNMRQSYLLQIKAYTLGFTDLLHVLTAQNQLTTASATRIRVQIDLDNLRVNLHRVMLTDQFASIPGCRLDTETAKRQKKLKPFQWVAEIFSGSASRATIDQMCRAR